MPNGGEMRLAVLAIAATLAACQQQAPQGIAVSDAWVRLSPVQGRPAAAYFNLSGGAQPERLVAVESPKAQRIELHEGAMKDGMATMRPIEVVDVPAGGKLSFAPGGSHAMLFGVDASIKPNAAIPLVFRFAGGKTITVEARTVAAGDDAHAGH